MIPSFTLSYYLSLRGVLSDYYIIMTQGKVDFTWNRVNQIGSSQLVFSSKDT